MTKTVFTAFWTGRPKNRRPAYCIEGKRVSRQAGFKHALSQRYDLPLEFFEWHNENGDAELIKELLMQLASELPGADETRIQVKATIPWETIKKHFG